MDFIARVKPEYFAALHHLAGTNDVRFYLNGITIERHAAGGVVMIGTDGHVLGAIHDPEGWLADGYDRITVARLDTQMLAACRKRRLEPVGGLWIAEHCAVLAAKLPDNPPPVPLGAGALHSAPSALLAMPRPLKWRRHFLGRSSADALPMPCVNPALIARFAAFAKDARDSRDAGLYLKPTGATTVVHVHFAFGDLADRFLGAVMPMRALCAPGTLPSWFSSQKPRA